MMTLQDKQEAVKVLALRRLEQDALLNANPSTLNVQLLAEVADDAFIDLDDSLSEMWGASTIRRGVTLAVAEFVYKFAEAVASRRYNSQYGDH